MCWLQFCSFVNFEGYEDATAVCRVAEVLCGWTEYRGQDGVAGNRKVAEKW